MPNDPDGSGVDPRTVLPARSCEVVPTRRHAGEMSSDTLPDTDLGPGGPHLQLIYAIGASMGMGQDELPALRPARMA